MLESLELFHHLIEQGVVLYAEGERLRLNAPKGVITPALQAAIADKKNELLRLVQQRKLTESSFPRVSRLEPQPLSFAQERLWALTQMAGSTPLYNMYLAFRLRGPLHLTVLEACLRQLIDRHEPLRTRFHLDHDQLMQRVEPTGEWTLPFLDVETDPQLQSRLTERIAAEAAYLFDPLHEGLFRVHLLRLATDEHVLILVMHHLISDGWSWNVFLRELTVLYAAHRRSEPASLPDLTVQYLDFAAGQRTYIDTPRYIADLAFWKKTLDGVTPLELPLDAARQSTFDFAGARASFDLADGLAEQLHTFSSSGGVTPFMTLLAAFVATLHQITGQPNLLIGTPVAGRAQAELQGIMGYFNNILPLGIIASGEDRFQDVLGRVKSAVLGANDHAEVPLHRLAALPGLAQIPFTRAVFGVQDGSGHTLRLDGLQIELLPVYNNTTNFDLFLTVQMEGKALRLVMEYRRALFQPTTIDRLFQDYATLLNAALTQQQARLIELLPSAQTIMQPQPVAVGSHAYRPPQSPLESRLVAIWEETLNQQPIGVADNFFDLGGHSLLALRLFSRIQQEFKVNLPLATLFREPTIHGLASLIEQGEARMTWDSLVAIQPKGSRPPFFGVHGMDGNVLFWRNIVLHLGEDQPFYGLQSRGIDGYHPALDSIPQMASNYVKEIRQVQPHGPYHLGGYSLGGEIAFEMAQQLRQEGEQVALLVMFDTANPNRAIRPVVIAEPQRDIHPPSKFRQRLEAWQRKLKGHMQRLESLPVDQKVSYMWKDAAMRLERIRLKFTARLLHRTGRRLPNHLLLQYLREAHIKAVMNYVPGIYPGKITIFRARESLKDNPVDSLMGWGPLAGQGLELVVFEGSHADVYNPDHADKIAEMLRQCLDQTP